jgi:leucyl-tRNA synthetase
MIGEDAEATSWPSFDESELIADETEYPLQVKGKVKARISLPSGLDKNALEEAVKAHPEYKAIIGDAEPRKLIVVPGKIINVVP